MQRVYSSSNIGMNYWGCYARVQIRGNELILDNTLTDRRIVITGTTENLSALYDMLEIGVSDEHLCMLLKKICGGAGKVVISGGNADRMKEVDLSTEVSFDSETRGNAGKESNARLLMEFLMQEGLIE